MMLWSPEDTVKPRKILRPEKRRLLFMGLSSLVCCAVFVYARDVAVAVPVMIGALFLSERALG